MIYEIYHKVPSPTNPSSPLATILHGSKPRNTPFLQRLLDFSMEVEPVGYEKNFFVDIFGNTNNHLLIRKGHQSLSVIGRSRVELFPKAIDEHLRLVKENTITYTALEVTCTC